MLENAGPQATGPRAYLRMGGVTLARHQLSLVLALGCERVICIARALDPEIVALQRAAEDAAVRFHVVTGPRALIALITANDEVIALNDGLLVAPEDVAPLIESGPGVWVQPIEVGLPAGFERIDLNHAAAGIMCVPGHLVGKLSDLPADFDAVLALQRIALQARVRQVELPVSLHENGAWRLIRDEAEAHRAEAEWIRQRTLLAEGASVTDLAVGRAVRSFGPALLHAGSGGNTVAMAALVLVLLALALGWFGLATLAFVCCALAWAIRRAAGLLLGIERQALLLASPSFPRQALFGWILDGALVVIVTWNQAPGWSGPSFAARAFPAVMLIALLRILPRALSAPWLPWLQDRTLLCVILAILAATGLQGGVVAGLAVALALLGVTWRNPLVRLTRA